MGQPTWRKITDLSVPGRPGLLWTPALDYVTQGKLYKVTVEAKSDPGDAGKQVGQKWTPESGKECSADGDPTLTRKDSLITDACAVGAMIAKVGGSSADTKPDKEKTLLFAAGGHCVFSVSDATKCGSLYLGVNDTPASLAQLKGRIQVTIYEGL